MQDRKSRLVIFGIKKIRIINLTQAGLKAMEELAKLEEERGNPAYMPIDGRRGKVSEKGAGAGTVRWFLAEKNRESGLQATRCVRF